MNNLEERLNRKSLATSLVTILLLGSSVAILRVDAHSGSTAGIRLNTWTIETIDSGGFVGMFSSQAIDSEDRVHIAYLDSTNRSLKYAVLNNSIWNITTVDNSVDVFCGISLALDSSMNPHISYIDWSYDLYYAHKTGISWSIEYVTSTGPPSGTGESSSIAMDSSDNPHILFLRTDTGEAVYASKSMGSWSFETIETPGNGHWVSLVMDSSDTPHASYAQTTLKDLKYATKAGGVWTNETVDFIGEVGYMASLCLDSSEQPRIAYLDLGNTHLKYAAKVNGSWIVETVDSSSSTGWYSSVDVNLMDRPGIAYESGGGKLTYAFKSSGTWEIETVDSDGDAWDTSLVFDPEGRPSISYYDHTKADLKYAWGSPERLPDLYVGAPDLRSTPSSPIANGSLATIHAVIHNIGTDNATETNVRFYDGDMILENQIGQDQSLADLPVGANSTLSVSWSPNVTGLHVINVIIDPGNSIKELNETNNAASLELVVLTPFPAPPTNMSAVLSGSGLQDVAIYWDLSADDGGGDNNIIGYDIVRNESYDSSLSSYYFLDFVPSGVSAYVDSLAGEGNPSNYFYYVCAVNAFNNSSCSSNQAGKFTRSLPQGPNLISIPLIQSNESIEYVLQTVEYDKAWTYRPYDNDPWKWYMRFKGYRRGLWNVNHTMGLWINVTGPSSLTVAGVVPAQTTMTLYAGWNLVSFPSFNTTYTVSDLKAEVGATRVEGFDGSALPHFLRALGDVEVLQAGQAYWVRVEADMVWTVFNP